MGKDLTPTGEGMDPSTALPGDQSEPEVKVNDRRIFNRDGQPRQPDPENHAGATPESPEAAPSPPQTGDTHSGVRTPPASAVSHSSATATTHESAGKGQRPLPQSVDFQSFVYYLYMTTLQELGVPAEQGGKTGPPDLERARFFIDILHVMETKTKGNLEPAELKLLQEILYNLQMHFVNLSGAGST